MSTQDSSLDAKGKYRVGFRSRAEKFGKVGKPDKKNPRLTILPPLAKGAKHLWSEKSDYPDFEMVVDSRNMKIYMAEDEYGWAAWDSRDRLIAEGTSRASLVKALDEIVSPELKPGMRWATEAEIEAAGVKRWRDVMVSNDPKSYKGIEGYDFKGKQQGNYSVEFRGQQDAIKFERMKQLQKKMPALDRYLKENVGDDSSDAAMMCRRLGMRPAHEGGTGDLETFGASTLLAKHVKVTPGGQVTLNFLPGKAKTPVTIKVKDKVLADMLRERLKTRKGNTPLFGDASANSIGDIVKQICGAGFKAKDLRTLKANALALEYVKKKKGIPQTKTEFRKWRNETGDYVSAVLGNQRTMALSSYINPTVFDEWLGGEDWLPAKKS